MKFYQVRKFRLEHRSTCELEQRLEAVCVRIADTINPIHKRLAPDCYNNMALFGDVGCRIGTTVDQPKVTDVK